MPNAFFLLPNLDYSGESRQALLLASSMPRERFELCGASLGGDGPLRPVFNRAGVTVEWYAGARFLDFLQLGGLCISVRHSRPDLIHVWGLPALRALHLAHMGRRRRLPPVVVSAAGRSIRKGKLGWWNLRLLRRATIVTASFEGERTALIAAGVDPARIVVIAPAVQQAPPPADPVRIRSELGVPPSARLIMAVGRMDNLDRFRNAIWGFDILKYLAKDAWLVLIGEGKARSGIAELARKLGQEDVRVAFAGARPDAASLLRLADVVWVANRKQGGVNVALEAMSAGKPIVASALPNLTEIVHDGETGLLVSPHDAPEFARRTWQLIGDPALARSLGEAGRNRAATAFSAEAMAEQFAQVYDGVASVARV